MRKGLLLVAVTALLSCATMKNDQTVCAEYRGLRCLAGASCHMDRARGCQVCQCDNVAGGQGADGNPTINKSPADQR